MRGLGGLEAGPGLQPRPIGRDGRRELSVEAELLSQQQRVAHRDVRRREPPGAQLVGVLQRPIHGPQPRQEPLGVVVGHHLGLAGLEAAVAQHQRLREGQRRLAEMQPVQPGAIGRIVRPPPPAGSGRGA